MLQGAKLTFDEESQALYDAVAPVHPEAYFQPALDELARLLPGDGPLVERYEAFRQRSSSRPTGSTRVFDRAIAECRSRTLPHIALPTARASPSSTSRTSRGAATTGTRATTAA